MEGGRSLSSSSSSDLHIWHDDDCLTISLGRRRRRFCMLGGLTRRKTGRANSISAQKALMGAQDAKGEGGNA